MARRFSVDMSSNAYENYLTGISLPLGIQCYINRSRRHSELETSQCVLHRMPHFSNDGLMSNFVCTLQRLVSL